MAAEAPPIPEELATFMQSGLSILVGTRDAARRPSAMRGVGLRVHDDRRSIDLFVPDTSGATTLANVRDNGRVAVTVSRSTDHRSIQVKGACMSITPSSDDDHAFLKRYVELWSNDVEIAGMPRVTTARLTVWPSTRIEIRVDAVFEQTPGPLAGSMIGERRS